ncbi:MAG: hypoxanthine phosphoribosyltransferase, partial [Betaproteobacteria bacterium]|nr:hypoxanthine phosphoribosyltransferase [Betaproteobacteria bacterium]
MATAGEVQAGIAAVAEAINRDFAGQILRVAPLLNGALPFAGMVLPQLTMPV